MGGFLYTLFNTGYCSMTLGQGLFVTFVTLLLGYTGLYVNSYFKKRATERDEADRQYQRSRGMSYGGKSESPTGRTIVHVNCDGGEGCPYPLDHKV